MPIVVLVMIGLLASATTAPANDTAAVREVRAILSDACFKCHGPDADQRQADLRLDVQSGLQRERDEGRIIAPGEPDESVLFRRITESDPDLRMPPSSERRQLTAAEIERLRRWIVQGADWPTHWSFRKPTRPAVPTVSDPAWVRNPIDAFVLKRLDSEGLRPSPPADRRTLIRRVTLDLTGLPPTPAEVDAFLEDHSPGAYERVVDRLLASPRYGEWMAGDWLDAARYADTSGYQNDGPREMWRWRDWVIDACNANRPFDEFSIEQLAGDMLPGATLSQRIATGFNRNHRGNAEGGIIPAEYAVEYVVDRVETTSTVWLGLTLGCARCHDHKYDPFTQEEFYRLFALFNNIPEHGRAIKEGNSPPYVQAPTDEQRRQLAALDAEIRRLAAGVRKSEPELQAALERRGAERNETSDADWFTRDGLVAEFAFDDEQSDPQAPIEPNASPKSSPEFGEGRTEAGRSVRLNGETCFDAGDVANFGYFDKFTLAAWVRPDDVSRGTIVSRMEDVPEGAGYSVRLADGRVEVDLVKRWLDDAIRVRTAQPVIAPGRWSHVAVTYDGSRLAAGIQIAVDGQVQPVAVELDYINQTFAAPEPLRIGAGHGPDGHFHGSIDEVRVYGRALSAEELAVLAEPSSIGEILQQPIAARTPRQSAKLRACFLDRHAPESIRSQHARLIELQRRRVALDESIPTVMVMQERPERRPTFVLQRGEYDKPGAEVAPGVPAALDMAGEPIDDRLALARWLFHQDHPLTARVAVNRIWQQHFGAGLVRTPEDFGSQGEPPVHPELLDWLATELVRLDWDMKALRKTIVTSATYMQQSEVSSQRSEVSQNGSSPDDPQRSTLNPQRFDPDNRLLSRGPRVRLSARAVRDQALFVSGLLVERVGGPSVKPYQPEGLWKEIATTTEYDRSDGSDLYRRSLYTYWKRTVAPPTMAIFDAAGRETCEVRTTPTNTPLQALALMNDVTFVEAARVFAERVLREAGGNPEAALRRAFLQATAREPSAAEHSILMAAWRHHRKAFRADSDAASDLISAGEFPRDPSIDPADLAAMTMVASLILNLDEVITKE
jgi:hypothetical protein